jgi:xanthine dehydrogenase accessory factor
MPENRWQKAALRAARQSGPPFSSVIMRRVNDREVRPAVIVLGSGDVGSAVAHALHRAGCAVVLTDAVDPAWPRRGMAFVDAWYYGAAELAGVSACFCASVRSIPVVLGRGDMIAATTWSWPGIAAALAPAAVVDARVAKRAAPAVLKTPIAGEMLTIGVGPGFRAGEHVDMAVESAWGDALGAVVTSGATRPFAGEPQRIGGAGRERYVYATRAGRFQTLCAIGERVEAGEPVGTLDGDGVDAPLGGVLRGLAARGARIAPGQKIVEVDPRGDRALCFGLGERPRRIAAGVLEALSMRGVLAQA